MNGTGGQLRGTVVLTLDARPENLALTRLALAGVAPTPVLHVTPWPT